MSLRTHEPSGKPPYPLILVEGQPKFGKSFLAYAISASDKVGYTWVFDMGEGTSEGYGRLGRYQIVNLQGTWSDFMDQLIEATKIPMVDGKPNVIIIDSITEVWNDLKDWVQRRANASANGRAILSKDPDADVKPSMGLWNDAKDRYGMMLDTLRRWPGIAIVIANAEEKTAIDDDGKPEKEGNKVLRTYKVDAEKRTTRDVTAIVRLYEPQRAALMGVRSLDVQVPPEGYKLPENNALESLVFKMLQPDGEGWMVPKLNSTNGLAGRDARREIYLRLQREGIDDEIAQKLPGRVWQEMGYGPDDVVSPETLAMLVDAAKSIHDDIGALPPPIGAGTGPANAGTGGTAPAPPPSAPQAPTGTPGGESPPEPPPGPETATQSEPPDPLGPTPEHIAEIEALIRPNLETMTVPKLTIDVAKAGVQKPARTKAALIDQLLPFLVAEELELEAADRAQNGTTPPPDAPEFDVDGQGADGPSDGALNVDNPPTETSEQLVARITQGVDRMPPREVAKALTVAGENPAGTIDELRARLVEYRVNRQAAPAAG